MKPQEALAALQRDPMQFLKTTVLKIGGKTQSGSSQFVIEHHRDQPGPRSVGPKEIFSIVPQSLAGDPYPFLAQNVRMIRPDERIDFNNIERYDLSANPPVMVTGQLSGCSIAVLAERGPVTVAHIKPWRTAKEGRGLDPTELKKALEEHGYFADPPRYNAGPKSHFTKVFGRGDYTDHNHVYVIGVHRGGQWEMYGQITLGEYNVVQIVGVKRIL